MACNSCHGSTHHHGGGVFDEELLKHGLSVPNQPFGKNSKGGLSKGVLILGGLVKWSKT